MILELIDKLTDEEQLALCSFLIECEETKGIGSDIDCGPTVLRAFRAAWTFIAISSNYEPKLLT